MTGGAPGRLALGLDAGGTATRWTLWGPGGTVARGEAPAWSGLAFAAGAERAEAAKRMSVLAQAVQRAVQETAQGTGQDAAVTSVLAGVTGVSAGDAAAEAVGHALAAALGLPAARVRVVEDVRVAYRAAFAPGEGILVYAGTGSVAVHERADGTLLRAGGHGHLIDDAGGGFWIGRHALRTVLRAADRGGRPARGVLAEAVYGALGTRDWPAIRDRVYGDPRGGLAALAPAVGAAARAEDPDALRIVEHAGEALAALAGTLRARLGDDPPVALLGGVTGLGAPLEGAFRAALAPAATVRPVTARPVEAAAQWAWAEAPPR